MKNTTRYLDWVFDNWLDIVLIILFTVLFYVVGSMIVRNLVRHAVQGARGRTWHRKDIEKRQNTLIALFVTLWRTVIVAAGVLIVLGRIPGINLAPLFASAGIIGVALGFGSQSLVKDFLSGIFIISDNQYRVGDVIEIDTASGTVERIGARSTVLRDADGNVHYFPNGTIGHVVNKTMGFSKARFSITILPDNDIDKVVKLINDIGTKLASEDEWQRKITEAPAFVSMGEFTANSVSLLISGKTQPSDQWSVVAEMRRRLFEAFDAKGIKLASTPLIPPTKK